MFFIAYFLTSSLEFSNKLKLLLKLYWVIKYLYAGLYVLLGSVGYFNLFLCDKYTELCCVDRFSLPWTHLNLMWSCNSNEPLHSWQTSHLDKGPTASWCGEERDRDSWIWLYKFSQPLTYDCIFDMKQ